MNALENMGIQWGKISAVYGLQKTSDSGFA
jgi:hypothetical protein